VSSRQVIRVILNIAGSAAILTAALLFSLEILNAGKIIFGVNAAEVPLAGKTLEEAQRSLQKRGKQYSERPLLLFLPEKALEEQTTPGELGVTIDAASTISEVFSYGRGASAIRGIAEQAHAFVLKKSPALHVVLKEDDFERGVSRIVAEIDQPAENATLQWNGKTRSFRVIPEVTGVVVDRRTLRAEVREHAQTLKPASLLLTLVTDVPEVTTEETAEAYAAAQAILEQAPYTLEYKKRSWTFSEKTVREMLAFFPEKQNGAAVLGVALDDKKIRAFLSEEILPAINREARDAVLTVQEDRVTAFALSRDGQTVNMNATIEAIQKSVRNLEATVSLVVHDIPPRVTTASIDALGLRSLLAVGETDFSGSPKNRVHNIKVGAAKYHGILIPPGEEFSFNENLGNVDADTGYLPELVIKRGKTVPEYGGGLCQVSTTAFRAAVLSGLEITRRYNHSYIVRYYGTPGFDATIYPPNPDLRFRNDTSGHVLIQTSVVGTKLLFEFYGTDDGREVKVVGPRVFDRKPDGSAKAVLTQEIWRDGKLARTESFHSSYRSPSLYPVSRRNPLE